jgi:hypothetical protein
MQLQHNTAFTVSESDTIDSVRSDQIVFRVSRPVSVSTSENGETAYLSFNANETKTIIIPLGYSSAERCRFIGKASGTLEFTVTHPTLGAQKMTVKNGSVTFSMRMTAISITEKAGASATLQWSLVQIDSTDPGAFS